MRSPIAPIPELEPAHAPQKTSVVLTEFVLAHARDMAKHMRLAFKLPPTAPAVRWTTDGAGERRVVAATDVFRGVVLAILDPIGVTCTVGGAPPLNPPTVPAVLYAVPPVRLLQANGLGARQTRCVATCRGYLWASSTALRCTPYTKRARQKIRTLPHT